MYCDGSDGGNTIQRRKATHMWARMSSGVELLPRKAHVNFPVAGTTGIDTYIAKQYNPVVIEFCYLEYQSLWWVGVALIFIGKLLLLFMCSTVKLILVDNNGDMWRQFRWGQKKRQRRQT